MGKRCNSCIVTRRTFSRLESQSRSRTNPSSLALLAAGRSPQVRRPLYGGTKWRRSDCTHHSHRLRMREICTGHCGPQRGRRSHSDTCRYRPKCRPYCAGSRARCHLVRWAVETARNAPRERPTVLVPERTSLQCHRSNWYSRRNSLGRQRCRHVRQGTYILHPTLPVDHHVSSCPRSRSVPH